VHDGDIPQPRLNFVQRVVMPCAGLLFLVVAGVLIPHGDAADVLRESEDVKTGLIWCAGVLWLLILIEAVAGFVASPDGWRSAARRALLVALCPPLRMTTATAVAGGWVRVPWIGWTRPGKAALERLERLVALPMTMIALLVVPVLIAEFGFEEALERHPRVAVGFHLATSLIWLGFALEMIWMLAVTDRKLSWCLRHWTSLIIVLLPFLAFLRLLRLVKFAPLMKAGKMLRIYRLRGMVARLWRTILVLEVVDRWLRRDKDRYRQSLEARVASLEDELRQLRAKLEECSVEGEDGNPG
jgi:hypothetical protein